MKWPRNVHNHGKQPSQDTERQEKKEVLWTQSDSTKQQFLENRTNKNPKRSTILNGQDVAANIYIGLQK